LCFLLFCLDDLSIGVSGMLEAPPYPLIFSLPWSLYLKWLEKEEKAKPKVNRRKEIKIRAEINYIEKKKLLKNTNIWRLNNTLLNNQEITEEIKEQIKKHIQTNDSENTMTQNLWDAAKAVLRRIYSNTTQPQETIKI